MSIVRCEECEKTIDIDKEEAIDDISWDKSYYWLCLLCHEEKENN